MNGDERIRRPWWASPIFWLGLSAVFLLLGLFVLPHFFGGVFIFLPFFWISPRKPRRKDRTPG